MLQLREPITIAIGQSRINAEEIADGCPSGGSPRGFLAQDFEPLGLPLLGARTPALRSACDISGLPKNAAPS